MNGNVSEQGITKDLEYMKTIGAGGLQHFDLDHYIPEGPVKHNSNEWHEMIQHSINEATRLGLDFGFNQRSGWSNSGGVWIKLEESMKTVVFTEMQVAGERRISIKLKQPQSKHNLYRDSKVLAFPTPNSELKGKEGFRIDNWKSKSVSFMHENDIYYRFPRDTREYMQRILYALNPYSI